MIADVFTEMGAGTSPDSYTNDWFAQNAPTAKTPTGTPNTPSYAPGQGPDQGGVDASGNPYATPTPDGTTGAVPTGGGPVTDYGTYAPGDLTWVNKALAGAESTDDLSQWYSYIRNDPAAMAGDKSAIAYWIDRINRGDGSKWVRNGTLQKFADNNNNPLTGFAAMAQGYDKTFTLPTMDEAKAMPGFQFAADQGQKAYDRKAASQGTLLAGGSKQDRAGLAEQIATGFYNNLVDQKLSAFNSNYNQFRNAQTDTWSRFSDLARYGLNAAGTATS